MVRKTKRMSTVWQHLRGRGDPRPGRKGGRWSRCGRQAQSAGPRPIGGAHRSPEPLPEHAHRSVGGTVV